MFVDGWWIVHTMVRPSFARERNSWMVSKEDELSRPLCEWCQVFKVNTETTCELVLERCLSISFFVSPTYVVGSSKNSTAGLSISSSAMDRRFFWPPLSLEHRVCFAAASFNVFSRWSIWKEVREEVTKSSWNWYTRSKLLWDAKTDLLFELRMLF